MGLQTSNVFVIDHDAASRAAVVESVRTLGVEVHPFESVEAFLANYAGDRPTCIITELKLLGMGADDLLIELRQRGLSIPVIVLTAHAETKTTVQVMKSGAFTTIDKPYRPFDLWEWIRRALQDDLRRQADDSRRQEIRQRIAHLNQIEQEVLSGVMEGKANKAIAHRLKLGLRTVEGKRKSLFTKMGVDSIAALVKQVMMAQLDPLPPPPPPPNQTPPTS